MANSDRVFEMRTYTATPGKREALQQRFRDHTLALFEKHGIEVVAFFLPTDDDPNTLVYFLAYPDLDTAKERWRAFQQDPDWITAKAGTEAAEGGSLTTQVESRFLRPNDFSPLR